MLAVRSSVSLERSCCTHTQAVRQPWHFPRPVRTACRRQRQLQCRAQSSTSSEQMCKALTVFCGISAVSLLTALSVQAAQLDPGHQPFHQNVEVYSLASNEDFWNNLTQYARFFVSVLAGTAYVAIKPLIGLLRKPSSAIGLLVGIAAFGYFLKATLTAMLGSADSIDPFLP